MNIIYEGQYQLNMTFWGHLDQNPQENNLATLLPLHQAVRVSSSHRNVHIK